MCLILNGLLQLQNCQIGYRTRRDDLRSYLYIAVYADVDDTLVLNLFPGHAQILVDRLPVFFRKIIETYNMVAGDQIIRIDQESCSGLDLKDIIGILHLKSDSDLQNALLVSLHGIISRLRSGSKCAQRHGQNHA